MAISFVKLQFLLPLVTISIFIFKIMTINTQGIKKTGATFTPPKLAKFITNKILLNIQNSNRKLKILDPACGEGILLSTIANKLKRQAIDFKLFGYDTNKKFLETANNILNLSTQGDDFELKNTDFLEEINIKNVQGSLFQQFNSGCFINNSMDVVIANPPYVRTQLLGSSYAQKIAKKFNLKGRIDLYYPFIIGITHALKNEGIVGVITSNRYLSTKSGASVRKFLEQNYDIIEVIDLGDTQLFDAAVLPAIFIGRKKSNADNTQSSFSKIYEYRGLIKQNVLELPNVYDILQTEKTGYFKTEQKYFKKTTGYIHFTQSKEANWNLLNTKETDWINKINHNSKYIIKDFFKVRVGIKTTADKVFIKKQWDNETFKPETALLKPLISQENIKPWDISTEKMLKVLYPHLFKNGKRLAINLDEFPQAKNYFLQHKERLSKREYLIKSGRQWFEIWVPQNPNLWKMPKIVFPDISPYPRFYFDEAGYIVNGNCYWIAAKNKKEKELLYLIQGIANSKLMTKYHDLMFNNKLYSGRRRYFSQFVEKYPLPELNSSSTQNIISIVKKLHQVAIVERSKLLENLELEVARAFNIEPI